MTSHHTLLTLGAMALLSTVLLNFYRGANESTDDVSRSEDMIQAAMVTSSYLEAANNLAFDAVTDSVNLRVGDINMLTDPAYLGPESAGEDSIHNFDDVDDYNGFRIDTPIQGTPRVFTTSFRVRYVMPSAIKTASAARTFLKEVMASTWRTYPPRPVGERVDTLRLSLAIGYYTFD